MSINKKGFDFGLTINVIDTVNPRISGEGTTKDGDEISWGHAVKFTSNTLVEEVDADGMVKDVEHKLEIEVPCASKEEIIKVNNFLRKLRNDMKSFKCEVNLPKYSNKMYKTKSLLEGEKFITLFNK